MSEIALLIAAAGISGYIEGRRLYSKRWMKEFIVLMMLIALILALSITHILLGRIPHVLNVVVQMIQRIEQWFQ